MSKIDFDVYNALPDKEKKDYQVDRKCSCGEPLVSVTGHSAGPLHTMCPRCKLCPDCEDGE